jgi:hypothetical protein
MSAEKIARFKPGQNIPVFAAELLPAGRLVVCSGAKTSQGDYNAKLAGANVEAAIILGATQRESGPTGDSAAGFTRRVEVATGGVVYVKAAGAITAGKAVYCSGSGEVKETASEKLSVGVCLNTIAEAGEYAEVLLA